MSTGPMEYGASVMGLPSGTPAKKATHRGRKKSGKPGAEHLSKLQQAHGAGDFASAKTHALNYAKAAHQHTPSDEAEMPGVTEEPDALPVAAAPSQPNRRAQLAKLAMTRKK